MVGDVGDYCVHGLLQRLAYGVDAREDGVEVCSNCVKPTFESAHASTSGMLGPRPDPVIDVTMNDVPGYRVEQVQGDVSGVIVLARNAFSNLGASMRTVAGGVSSSSELVVGSRHEAQERMVTGARTLGAGTVVAAHFDCSDVGDIISQLTAYGTAVTISRVSPESSS
jgi:uncharacterized protein YbjQ (UPF0145 family)